MVTTGIELRRVLEPVLDIVDLAVGIAPSIQPDVLVEMPQHLRPEQEVSPLLTFDQREYDAMLNASAHNEDDFHVSAAGRLAGQYLKEFAPAYKTYLMDKATGSGCHPSRLSESVRRGLSMWGMCDFVSVAIFPLVEHLVKNYDKSITLSLISVVAAPRLFITFRTKKDEPVKAPVHSLLLLTTASKDRYVLDPTGEQTGVLREHRFLPWTEYKRLYVVPQGAVYWTGSSTFACQAPWYADEIGEAVIDVHPVWADVTRRLAAVLEEWKTAGEQGDLVELARRHLEPLRT